ncbi:DinB family protein [Dictyobacter arantiisoli]|uniref:DinB family protein n=1 Tax=Dictyobacter arantiisoli TaxID=2014874 RepID=UPI001F399ABE|nr:DinB family protein [Dictyobacter arantiisoli]
MTTTTNSLWPFYQGWDNYQQHLLQAIRPLTDEQLNLRVAPQQRTVHEITAHIVGARAGWFHLHLGEGDATMEDLSHWDDEDAPIRSTKELLHGLEATWAMIEDCLKRWNPASLNDNYIRTRDGEHRPITRQWIIWHVLEHDLNHGGELFLTLGTHGHWVPDL